MHDMKFIIFIIVMVQCQIGFGQYNTNASKSELGVMVGGTYYIGDLNRYYHFNNTHLAGGLIYRYNIHSRMAFRANAIYGKVSADDASNKWESTMVDRNLNFSSTIFEGAAGIELYYVPFHIGKRSKRSNVSSNNDVTAYLLAQIGAFRMNPKTEYNGQTYELQPLGTEGQGTSLTSKKHYSLIQMCIPLGVGLRFAMGSWGSMNLEFSARKLFTDYLDDVHANNYVDLDRLSSENGPLSAELSNRSLSGSKYALRGNASTKDWYFFTGMTMAFKLGKQKNCMPWK